MQTNKTLGVMIYVDNSATMLQEFEWIYKSWIFSGNWTTSDLIVVHHPDVAHALPLDDEGIVGVPCLPVAVPGSPFEGYHFMNSIGCVSGPHIDDIALRYPFLLRTDADVFLTSNLVDFRPSYPVHGRGHYHRRPDFREKMLDFCKRHGVIHHNHFGCGSSLLAQSQLVVPFLRRQTYWCEKLLRDFGDDPANWGTWPDWFRGVSSMYAAEIAAAEAGNAFLRLGRERILDVESFCDEKIDSLVFHIHAVHTDTYFSKFEYRNGAYDDVDINALDISYIDQYCHWLAATPLEDIKRRAAYPQ
ncbi:MULTISPECIES: hypothetical protein [unclassified Caballeronia]|uniref:DUF7164 domain-containing protein n=1 Tax=unclassified Caballeronia TaxID=2646786 RepID=UPI002855F6E3|nr:MULTISPECIES: hypothetical protein [unclassified Caballeronia]MDR5740685.1 hypothetical protein [Caballeronia sp. LZ016]MDR5808792.1 hypothetical protein [Caballeronia sp. LZ019]